MGWGNNIKVGGPWDNDWNLEMDEVEHGWDRDVDYIMKEDGLYTLDGEPADSWKKEKKVNINNRGIDIKDGKTRVRINENGIQVYESDTENYRYENERHQKALDSIQTKVKTEQQKLKDSLQKVKDKIEQELQNINNKQPGTTAKTDNSQFVLPVYNPMMMLINK